MYIGTKVLRRVTIRTKAKAKKPRLLVEARPAVLPLPADWPGAQAPLTMPAKRDRR